MNVFVEGNLQISMDMSGYTTIEELTEKYSKHIINSKKRRKKKTLVLNGSNGRAQVIPFDRILLIEVKAKD